MYEDEFMGDLYLIYNDKEKWLVFDYMTRQGNKKKALFKSKDAAEKAIEDYLDPKYYMPVTVEGIRVDRRREDEV